MRLVSVPSEKLAWVLSQLAITARGEVAGRCVALDDADEVATAWRTCAGSWRRAAGPAAGQMRLLGRAWIVPEASEKPLGPSAARAARGTVPQHRDFRTRNPLGVAEVTTAPGEEGRACGWKRGAVASGRGAELRAAAGGGPDDGARVLVIVSGRRAPTGVSSAVAVAARSGEAESPERPSNQDGASEVGEVSRSSPANTRAGRRDGVVRSRGARVEVRAAGGGGADNRATCWFLHRSSRWRRRLEKSRARRPGGEAPGQRDLPRTIVVLVTQVPERFTLLP